MGRQVNIDVDGYAVRLLQQVIICGKPKCKRCKGPQPVGHGPYWYAHIVGTGKLGVRVVYVGKQASAAKTKVLAVLGKARSKARAGV